MIFVKIIASSCNRKCMCDDRAPGANAMWPTFLLAADQGLVLILNAESFEMVSMFCPLQFANGRRHKPPDPGNPAARNPSCYDRA